MCAKQPSTDGNPEHLRLYVSPVSSGEQVQTT